MQGPDDTAAIFAFEGKRNCCFTLVFGDCPDAAKQLDSVERKVNAIKHENKAGQARRVLTVIREKLEAHKTQPVKHVILCCGLGNDDNVHFWLLELPKNAVVDGEFEYAYDYTFHVERIKELLYADVIQKCANGEAQVAQLAKLSAASSPLLLLGKDEVMTALAADDRRVGTIVWFGSGEIAVPTLHRCREVGVKIIKCPDSPDFCDRWGRIFALLRY
jgi:hypothetical protein